VQELDAAVGAVRPEQPDADRVRDAEADDAADERVSRCVMAVSRRWLSNRTTSAASVRAKPTLAGTPTGRGWRTAAAYATAATNETRASANQAMGATPLETRRRL